MEAVNTGRFLQVALEAAKASGTILKGYWGKLSDVQDKVIPGDLITEADKASEDAILKILKSYFPSHSILAEESGWHRSHEHEFLWAIDPLDGTTNYAHQFPFFSVSIALIYRNSPIVGVVYNPIMDELFYSALGEGAFLNQTRLKVSKVCQLQKSLLATGFSYRRREVVDNNYQEFCYLTNSAQGVRRAGCASIDLAYVAAGRLDAFWENDLNTWDIAAGVLLVNEAGGEVSTYDMTPLNLSKPKILASNGLIHKAVSDELQKVGATIC